MILNAPCKNCQAREIGCHSTCDAYLDYRQAKDKENAERIKDAELRANDRTYREKKLMKLRKVVGQR